jgi:hypothetical protein
MRPETAARVHALKRTTIGELRAEYRQVFGEESRSHNRQFLWKRIAWRLQELDEGGLSERALRRARELANDADLRIRWPKGTFEGVAGRTVTGKVPVGHDPRLPMPGAVLTREYRGQTVQVTVLQDGFEYDGEVYRSLTAVAKAITGSHWNGPLFFGLRKAGGSR